MSHIRVVGIERAVPALLGLLRACSGLVAIIALLAILVSTTFAGRLERERTLVVPAVSSSPAPATSNLAPVRGGAADVAAPAPDPSRIIVLYLVETLAQAELATLGEKDFAADSPHRSHRTFLGVEEFLPGVQRVTEEMLAGDAPGLIQVVDLRGID